MWQAIVEIIGLEDKQNWKKLCDTEVEADEFIAFHMVHPSVVRWGTPKSAKKNLSIDPEWLEAQTIENRKKEYPSIDSVVEALIEHIAEGRSQKLQEIQAQREAVKIKYPKQGAK
jgi:carbamate kinase